MISRFGKSFTGKFQEEASAGLPSEAPPVRGFGAKESCGWAGRKFERGGTGDRVPGFFGSRFFRHEDVLTETLSQGNEKLRLGGDVLADLETPRLVGAVVPNDPRLKFQIGAVKDTLPS